MLSPNHERSPVESFYVKGNGYNVTSNGYYVTSNGYHVTSNDYGVTIDGCGVTSYLGDPHQSQAVRARTHAALTHLHPEQIVEQHLQQGEDSVRAV